MRGGSGGLGRLGEQGEHLLLCTDEHLELLQLAPRELQMLRPLLRRLLLAQLAPALHGSRCAVGTAHASTRSTRDSLTAPTRRAQQLSDKAPTQQRVLRRSSHRIDDRREPCWKRSINAQISATTEQPESWQTVTRAAVLPIKVQS